MLSLFFSLVVIVLCLRLANASWRQWIRFRRLRRVAARSSAQLDVLDLDSSSDEPPSAPISADVVPVLPADPQPDPEPELPIPTGRSTQVCGPLGLFRCTEVLVGEEIHTQYEPIDRHGKSRGSVREAHEPLEAVTDWLFKSRQVA